MSNARYIRNKDVRIAYVTKPSLRKDKAGSGRIIDVEC